MTAVLVFVGVGVVIAFLVIDRRSAKNVAILIGALLLIILVLILKASRS